tara:strand:+ start:769 stop:963 length:195 start_codon:yes stop_codon:yes gene_type:complete
MNEVEVGNLIKLTRQPDDDSIWIVLKVKRFIKSTGEDKVNAVRIRDMNSPREIWYPSRHIEVIG